MNFLKKYVSENSQFKRVLKDIFDSKPVMIDHLAHRTFNINNLYDAYSPYKEIFNTQDDLYTFKNHNAVAEWWKCIVNPYNNEYVNKENKFINTPRIFVSRYLGVKNDHNIQNTDIDLEEVDWYIKNRDKLVPFNLYERLSTHNGYLAWTLLHRENVNHVGLEVINIHSVAEKICKLFPLNNPDAPVQVSEDGDLLQFSTKSTIEPFLFLEGYRDVPHNFLEFVERKNGRDGFSGVNANVVFNSTKK
tara:strand:+ start:1566 stop:2306 length:741 start_codon:yes stop_codon:yes gene_type:complete